MASWYSAWLPGLPSLNFALPTNLQRRFISFVLKKSLGHFLRPGQLDYWKVDSQINSGNITINDLELDNKAINDLISDLPIVLHDGHISSVVAKVPWPNPLTSSLGFSIDSLRLTFHLLPATFHDTQHKTSNLADSMASVAESFVHDELTPQELWNSFHTDMATTNRAEDDLTIPGGLAADPLLYDPEEVVHSDVDPAGVSIFATLIERLLARFEFDAANTKVTVVHPGNMSITASISEICYRTDATDDASNTSSNGQQRTMSITGLNVTALNLRPQAPPLEIFLPNTQPSSSSPFSPSTDIPHDSPSSSSSSLDEDTQFAMSQSLAFLPPRPVSPTSSVASSMYQSAISTAPTSINKEGIHSNPRGSRTPSPSLSTNPHLTGAHPSSADQAEILASFGSSPILIHISTPPSTAPEMEAPSLPQIPPPMDTAKRDESLSLSVTLGTIACALRAWHIRGLLSLADNFTPLSDDNEDSDSNPTRSGLDCQISVDVRGVVLLVPMPLSRDGNFAQETSLGDFFNWPLVPPALPYGYLRFYLETISASVTSSSSSEDMKRARSTITITPLSCGLTVGDVSLFSITSIASPSTAEPISLASPILVTDTDLSRQYVVHHHHPSKDSHDPSLPIIEVMDWTDQKHRSNGIKLSSWRSKFNRRPTEREGRIDTLSPAISALFKRRVAPSQRRLAIEVDEVDIKVIPLHVLLDLGTALRADRILAFLDEAVGDRAESGYGSKDEPPRCDESGDSDKDAETPPETPPASPRARSAREREKERRQLERLVLDDLDLDVDYGVHRWAGEPTPTKQRAHKSIANDKPNLKISVAFDMIRIQVRCPSPPQYPPRSGALVIDLNGIRLSTAPDASRKAARFAVNEAPVHSDVGRPVSESFILGAAFERIIVACCPAYNSAATSIFSVGSLASGTDDNNLRDALEPMAPLCPRIAITKSKPASAESSTVMVLSIDIPSVVVDISKPILDSLQYWADDVAQHMDRTFSGDHIGDNDDTRTEKTDSRGDTSLIGSHFFVKSSSGSGSALSGSAPPSRPETAVKLLISEAFVKAAVPRVKEGCIRPFIVAASDIDVLVELKPEGKEETHLTLGVMAVDIINVPAAADSSQIFMSLTSPRSLASVPKSMVKLRFTSLVVPGTVAKESRLKLTLSSFTFTVFPDISWIADLGAFAKSPPGTFESVIPSERTRISVKISDGAIRALAPNHPGAVVIQVEDFDFATDVVGKSPDSSFRLFIPAVALLAVDDVSNTLDLDKMSSHHGVALWTSAGFALLAKIGDLSMGFTHTSKPPTTHICIDRVQFQAHICADSLAAVTAFVNDLGTVFKSPGGERTPKLSRGPTMVSKEPPTDRGLMASVDNLAFKKVPDVGPAPDMISDDLPTNMDYLDESFGTAAGLRELRDDDLDEFDIDDTQPESCNATSEDRTGVTSRIGGETIKVFRSEGIQVTENYYDNMPPASDSADDESTETTFQLRIRDGDITLFLYDGYDWAKTRKTIEEEVKDMRRRLAKIRQLVASGQAQDPNGEETGALLFNSLYIGLDPDVEPGDIIAAIDDELKEDVETASQSSWQSLKPAPSGKTQGRSVRVHGKRLTRSRNPSLEFRLFGLVAEVDHYLPDSTVVSRTLATVRDLEILDHIKTSTWKKFLTSLRSDSRGNVRETHSNMVRVELRSVRPVPDHPVEEARLRAKILPLRLYVDQDAVDFLKAFFSFKSPDASPTTDPGDGGDIYFQSAEVFPIDLKLDYKPRRVDYRALREGRTIELMNFFHFDGAEMTLRHITLSGITGWPRLFDLLNDLWTPDVKATQLVEVISGVSPIRSVVNVGSGVADLVLLPIAQYKKDGRIVRGVQKGTNAFVKSTAIEAIKLGARLATGTQVILEQAEGVLGGHFNVPITAEAVQNAGDDFTHLAADNDESDLISKYAQQPVDIKEGVQSAYKSLRRNFNSAAQTILAVPMEVYERSGNEGPVRSVIRAVPIAVLKPMIGASEAVSKTLLGLHNTLDPDVRHENEAKYKRR